MTLITFFLDNETKSKNKIPQIIVSTQSYGQLNDTICFEAYLLSKSKSKSNYSEIFILPFIVSFLLLLFLEFWVITPK